MSLGPKRDQLLAALARARGGVHRYTLWRWAVGVAFTAAVAALPLSGLLRFDLWGGRHLVLGEPHDFPSAAKAFAFPFLAINVAIVLASRFVGRYLCGFVCPYGALARLAEWIRRGSRTFLQRLRGALLLAALCLVLAGITFSFWVDWRVFVEGTPRAVALSAAFLLGTALSLFAGITLLGLRFCRDWCPSGVYFAVLGHDTANGIEFAHPEACTDCHACETICPSDLLPRRMRSRESRDGSGFYPDSLTNFALCVRCGDCVAACEVTTRRTGEPTPLRMGFLPAEARLAAEAGDERDSEGAR